MTASQFLSPPYFTPSSAYCTHLLLGGPIENLEKRDRASPYPCIFIPLDICFLDNANYSLLYLPLYCFLQFHAQFFLFFLFNLARDSAVFSPCDYPSIDDQSDEPPPLPPRRQSTLSWASSVSDESDLPSPPRQKCLDENEISISMLQVFNDLFMLCSKCQNEAKKKPSSSRKRRSSKKWENRQGTEIDGGLLTHLVICAIYSVNICV